MSCWREFPLSSIASKPRGMPDVIARARITSLHMTSSNSAWALLEDGSVSSSQPASQRKSSLQELTIASFFHREIKQFSHTYACVNAASVKQVWSLHTHTQSCQSISAVVHKVILLLSGAIPKVPQLKTQSWRLVPAETSESSLQRGVWGNARIWSGHSRHPAS